ncbi:DUF4229 domain-containing protein [Protaetiibacter mangrovi]|uniref:DUF4229 domain-containing protein n=1 Tax=Protaetiibacter mangrovi TaxID=2970926 RepID=A0ABT1ZGB1_9MICO|nr:DUF4229 domain-containing protein [Protaetiibacter mangrovi]MCS0499729.1 DUF4229 domain-containing protein [Protaetiibacter mangrovi]TPX03535.1 DUF4229 domain-containing protein [Schumannella luteola]
MPAWIPYTLLRLALFGGTFALLYLVGLPYWLAAIVATVIGLTVAYIFFPTLRNRVSTEFAEGRERARAKQAPVSDERGVDERAEDGE